MTLVQNMWYIYAIISLLAIGIFVPANSYGLSKVTHLSAAQWGPHRYLLYQNLTSGSTYGIFFQGSNDSGMTFSAPVELTRDLSVNGTAVADSKNPIVGAFSDEVYIIFEGKLTTGTVNLFYTTSSDGGKTFSNVTDVSNNTKVDVLESSLLVDRDTGEVFVSYVNDDGSVVACHVHCKG